MQELEVEEIFFRVSSMYSNETMVYRQE